MTGLDGDASTEADMMTPGRIRMAELPARARRAAEVMRSALSPHAQRVGVRPARARRAAVVATLAITTMTLGSCVDLVGAGHRDIEIMWPTRDAVLYDYEVFRARVRGYDLDQYDIYWYVDDSRERRMWDERRERPQHKAYEVDTYYWDWRGTGPYTVGFIAEDRHGREIAHRTVRVYVR
jgi:hypothetical protein